MRAVQNSKRLDENRIAQNGKTVQNRKDRERAVQIRGEQ